MLRSIRTRRATSRRLFAVVASVRSVVVPVADAVGPTLPLVALASLAPVVTDVVVR